MAASTADRAGGWGDRALGALQSVGRSLMLPIAVLPAAALLLRLGQPDLLDIPWLAAAGQAIFDNLPALFAIEIAVGLTGGAGAAGLAGFVGYFVFAEVFNAVAPQLGGGARRRTALRRRGLKRILDRGPGSRASRQAGGADVLHLGDMGAFGVSDPMNVMAASLAIRGRRHTYRRMAMR